MATADPKKKKKKRKKNLQELIVCLQ